MDLRLYKYPVVTSVVSILRSHGDKDNHTIYFLCVQNGLAGGRWSSLRKLYGRNHDLVDRIGIYVSQMTTNMFRVITVFTVFRLLTDFVCLYNYEF